MGVSYCRRRLQAQNSLSLVTNTSHATFMASSSTMEADSSVRSRAMCSACTDLLHGDNALRPEDAAYELDAIEHPPDLLPVVTSQHVHAGTKDG